MNEAAGRPKIAVAYMWLAGILTLEVVLQGFLFSGFYSEGDTGFIDIHGMAGSIAGFLLIIPMIPFAFTAKFPKGVAFGWLTVLWAVAWNIQAHVLGFGIEDVRWLAMIHISLAFAILGLGAFLTTKAYLVVRKG